jgi:hypothetical protein
VLAGLILEDMAAWLTGLSAGIALGIVFGVGAWWYPLLIVDQQGVEVRQIGYRLASSWRDIGELRRVPGHVGFVLKTPMTGPGAHRMASATKSIGDTPEILVLVMARRYIPIDPFAYWLDHGDLWQRILSEAPWLGEEFGSEHPK